MIITVTLNAALDKTLEVPNFTPGRRHRTVDQTTMPGGKGVNVARAIKRLGQPVIATGIDGRRDRATRIVEALNDESILNALRADPRGVAHQHRRARPDHRHAHRDQRARTRRLGSTSSSCSARSCCTSPRAPASACSPAACRVGSSPTSTRRLIREVRKLGVTTIVDTDGEPLRLAVRAEPDVVSPNELEAEELVGHEFNDDDDRARCRRRDDPSRRGRGDHDRARRLLRAGASRRARHALPRARRGAGGRARASARATRFWPATSRLATRDVRRSSACASASPAAPSRPSTSAPGSSIRRRSSGCSTESSAGCSRRIPGRDQLIGLGGGLTGAAASIEPADGCRPSPFSPASPARAVRWRVLRCRDGSRDRARKEGPAGVRLRRHRDRAVTPDAGSRRRRHHLDARPLPVRAAAAGRGAGRRRLARDGGADRQARRARRAQPRGHLLPLRGRRRRSSSGSRRSPRTSRRARCRTSTASRSSPS